MPAAGAEEELARDGERPGRDHHRGVLRAQHQAQRQPRDERAPRIEQRGVSARAVRGAMFERVEGVVFTTPGVSRPVVQSLAGPLRDQRGAQRERDAPRREPEVETGLAPEQQSRQDEALIDAGIDACRPKLHVDPLDTRSGGEETVVAFLTFLLGLTVGVQRIELAVDHRVASVELRLDGRVVGALQGAPWVAEVDFGRALLPHHLEAIARDAEGNEIDRALQRVNLPREAAEATLKLEGGEKGYTGAELSWRAADESEPEEIQVRFDGELLEVEGKRVTLPPHDRKQVHVLAAELLFHDQLRAQVEVAFGGEYGEEVSTELTAVPLELDTGNTLPAASEVASWLRIGDQAPRVVAVERGPRELVLVRDDASTVTLRSLGRQTSGTGPRRTQSAARMSAGLAVKDTLRLIGTHPMLVPVKGGGYTALFPQSANVNAQNSGLGFVLTNLFFRSEGEKAELLAEAVSVAGLRAAASNRARGVIVVRSTDSPPPPAGSLEASNVRDFLAALRVPLFYWTVGPAREGGAADAWGGSVAVRGWGGVHGAVNDLVEALRPQFLVWVEGLHRPSDITLAPDAPAGLRLAGADRANAIAVDTRPSRPANPAGAG